jgi:hypothetical protein
MSSTHKREGSEDSRKKKRDVKKIWQENFGAFWMKHKEEHDSEVKTLEKVCNGLKADKVKKDWPKKPA